MMIADNVRLIPDMQAEKGENPHRVFLTGAPKGCRLRRRPG
jgi:hypothetical protein